MASPTDHPIRRFGAFLLGLLLISLFGIVCFFSSPFLAKGEQDAAYEVNSKRRLEIKKQVDSAQAEVLKDLQPEASFKQAAASMISDQAVADPSAIVPGSPTSLNQ